jgi:TolB-like protein
MGDGALVEFASVVDAVQCGVELQRGMVERNVGVPQDRRIEFRVGINMSDVLSEGDDIYGDGVNVAARLQSLAEPCGICISGTVHDAIGNKLAMLSEFMGEQQVKNIERSVRAFRIVVPGAAAIAHGVSAQVPSARPKQDTPTLAVKPFASVSSDPEWANLADGITNGILVALTCTPGLTLIQDESASLAKSSQMTVPELVRRFDVRFVLKGSVRKFGDKFRVSAELLNVASGQYLWAEQFDRDLRDVGELFAVQDEITEQIVTALDVKLLTGEVARFLRKSLKSRVALEYFYRGEDLLWCATTKLEFHEAERLLEEVIRLEPMASVGYAEAGLAYWSEAKSGLSDAPAHAVERAMDLCRQAVALKDVTGYPHLVMAQVHLSRREYDEAEAAASRAVLARPSCPNAFALKAGVLNYLGRSAEAIEFAQYAERLTPVVPSMYPAVLASAYHGCERHEQAIAAAKRAIELDDQSVDPYLILAASSVALDHTEEAKWAAGKLLRLKPEFKLADYAASQPYKELKQLDRLLHQLRSAGLA